MTEAKAVVEMAGAVLLSFSLALGLEWCCLRVVMTLMPAQSLTRAPEAGGSSTPKNLLK